ncbi:hypothetical protein IQ266_17700 [filamentous cyanobacterium LEGE 11480]|uniref:Uncharacterized protein n=1 Tax=Romeriopsis navalis LEGE 11480 TaxID=2777977 RepID=A0A928VS57_9CYAN|nr:PH domain-containing protein [Romeriopsis navalis]MBE9031570.1 hypothetical protein [Romeriopsis navalis LEGE 11480]
MKLNMAAAHLMIELSGWERLWAVHVGPRIVIPFDEIEQVRTTAPETTWRELRAPGTFFPGVIKAGTYYTDRGRTFWYTKSAENVLCLDLSADQYYKQIVLTVDQNRTWADRINQNRR